ncbi:AtpZ/AtpI family protein [Candidatus Riflebacteria bacterium]
MSLFNNKDRNLINLAYALPMTIAGCVCIGLYLDQRFSTNFYTPLFFFIGILSGAVYTIRGFRKITRNKETKNGEKENGED